MNSIIEISKKPTTVSYSWVPMVYLMQGLPFALVTGVSPILFKTLGLSNSQIAFYTSLFLIPWILKFLLAPALEKLASKRTITLSMQFLIALLTAAIAINLYFAGPIYIIHFLFIFIAFAAAIHDINVDGLYLESLTYQTQARLIGIRTVFYQLGKFMAQGGVILLVGLFVTKLDNHYAWMCVTALLAIFIIMIATYNQYILPFNRKNEKIGLKRLWITTIASYQQVFHNFRQLPNLISATIFILFYNFPDTQLNKMIPLYLLDNPAQGGLGLDLSLVGIIHGILGIASMLVGVTLSGIMLEKFSLKKCLLPFTSLMTLANASFLILNTSLLPHSIYLISVCVMISQFFFGLCNGAYMLYLIKLFSKGRYSMSLYAIATALMLLGLMLAGAVSGWLQSLLGYFHFFIWIILMNLIITALAFYNARKMPL